MILAMPPSFGERQLNILMMQSQSSIKLNLHQKEIETLKLKIWQTYDYLFSDQSILYIYFLQENVRKVEKLR